VSDWELLEAAGRAVGIVWDPDAEAWIGDGVRFDWNPLADDGDALRLAVKLRLTISPGIAEVTISVPGNLGCLVVAFDAEDPLAATRRAIVCAAPRPRRLNP
jgi:hypothetical protein